MSSLPERSRGLQHVDPADYHLQRDFRCLLQQLTHGRRQQELRRRRHDADAHVTREAPTEVADFALGVLHVEAGALGPLEQPLAGRGQANAAAGLLEQGHATSLFEPAPRTRQRRLRR